MKVPESVRTLVATGLHKATVEFYAEVVEYKLLRAKPLKSGKVNLSYSTRS